LDLQGLDQSFTGPVRLCHLCHSTIFEINVDSYRRRTAIERKQQGPGRPPGRATINDSDLLSRRDNQTPT
jgi:hypothetical protein